MRKEKMKFKLVKPKIRKINIKIYSIYVESFYFYHKKIELNKIRSSKKKDVKMIKLF